MLPDADPTPGVPTVLPDAAEAGLGLAEMGSWALPGSEVPDQVLPCWELLCALLEESCWVLARFPGGGACVKDAQSCREFGTGCAACAHKLQLMTFSKRLLAGRHMHA